MLQLDSSRISAWTACTLTQTGLAESVLCPLNRSSTLKCQANTTLKSVTFGGGKTKIGRDDLVAVLQMLTTNQSMTRLGIYDDESLRPEDIIKIMRSLERNASLMYLSLQDAKE